MPLFPEFENENRFRNYPFSEGSVLIDTSGQALDTSMFVDAMIYPRNISGDLRLTSIDFETNTLEVSDDNGVVGGGTLGDTIELFSDSGPIGTIITRGLVSTSSLRRNFDELYFASSCVFSFEPAGVLGLRIGNDILTGKIVFDKSNNIRPSITQNEDGEYILSLDVTSTISPSDTPSINTIVVMHSKGSVFSIRKVNSSTLNLELGEVSRFDICQNAHREDMIDIYDTCDPNHTPPHYPDLPYTPVTTYEIFNVGSLTDQTFNITADNIPLPPVVNPVNAQMVLGTSSSNLPKFKRNMTQEEADVEMKKLTSSNVTGNGVLLQIPGLL